MFKKNLYLLLISAALIIPVAAVEMMEMVGMDLPEDMEMTDADVRSCKCKKFRCINVCGGANIGGNLTVGGSVTANSFITPTGLLFNGLRNYAVLSNQSAIASGDTVLWASTPAGNLSSGITVNNLNGIITLPTTGIFLVQYTVRFNIDDNDAASVATVQLEQNGINISQAAVTLNTAPANSAAPDAQVSAYALITTTPGNNTINLDIAYTNGFNIPIAAVLDANAQMTILQLN